MPNGSEDVRSSGKTGSHRGKVRMMRLTPISGNHGLTVRQVTGPTSRPSVCAPRQGELKRGAVRYVCRGPQPTTVGFDDRTADRQPHTHTAGFGSEERVE